MARGRQRTKAASRSSSWSIEFRLAFAALSTAIAGVVSSFSNRYLHRESGYNRYFVLLAMFVTGMLLVALAGQRGSSLHRVGTGRPQLGAARGVLPRPAGSRIECVPRDIGLPHQRCRHAVGRGPAASRRRQRQPRAALRRRGADDRTDGWQRDTHRHPPYRGRRVQERVAAVLELAAAGDGGTHTLERRLLWVALDSRRVFSVAARGAAARTSTRGASPRRRTRRSHGAVRRDRRRACRAT